MKSDVNGCSGCAKGQESHERFYSSVGKKNLIQYDYRTEDGRLFSCIAPTLEAARKKRDNWLGWLAHRK